MGNLYFSDVESLGSLTGKLVSYSVNFYAENAHIPREIQAIFVMWRMICATPVAIYAAASPALCAVRTRLWRLVAT